jgi:hypothetical protein
VLLTALPQREGADGHGGDQLRRAIPIPKLALRLAAAEFYSRLPSPVHGMPPSLGAKRRISTVDAMGRLEGPSGAGCEGLPQRALA